jgi:hypothetical protein
VDTHKVNATYHTHWKIPTIEGWGNPSSIWNVMEKNMEINRKVGKIGWVVNQMPTLGLEHDNIQVQWASNIPLENMSQKVWWCRCFKMESWSWTICCPMNYSSGGRHIRARGNRKSHATLKCCWKGNVLLLTCAKVSKRKGCWLIINLPIMT